MYKQEISSAIKKYRDRIYTENKFQDCVESIAFSITESHLHHIREYLLEMESALELIKFTITEEKIRSKFLEKIQALEEFTEQFDFK